ncbi:MAG: hypothetical protein E5V46_02985 [Mesorhizobium sp.]|nr:MAG: hypothetical protein E5V46_02985 [Mesorhizobium sp.]
MVPALPILPPPGLDRDLVLQRLATCDFADKGVKIDPVAWSDDATTLTLGQIAMCESALERLTWSGDPASAADLRPSRTILALGTRTDTGKPQQSPTIGFRGLAQLSWRYAPMATIPAAQRPALSETAAFKIYQARCPLEASLAKAAANGEVTLTAVDGKGAVRLSGTSDAANAALASIELGVPAVVLIPQANGLCIAYVIRSAKGARAATAAQLKSIDGQPLPTKGAVTTATLHLGHGLWIVEQNPKTPQLNGKLFVPLGGGPQETFVWWIAPLSYAGLEARTQDCPACCQTLTGSIQPPPPLQYQATQPTRADEHRLEDVAKYRAFLPAGVVDDSDAASLPRLVINWTAGDQSSDVFLMIERDEQEIKKQDARIMAMLDMKAWEALKAIEGLKDGAAIEKAWLGAIRTGWLRGMPVEAEPSAPTTFRRIGLRAKIPATAGIVQLTDPTQPAGSAKRPTFIDYFGRNGDDMVVMNGNYEFRYRLRAFRDLGTGSDGPHYLYSRPTAWTNFAIPERPPIQVVAQMGAAQPADYSLFAPRVTFRLQTPEKITERTSPWFFRALLRRYVEVPMPSASPGKPSARAQWIDVGQTAVIEWNGIAAEITDDELQREWAAQKLNPNYRIQVQAFRRDDTDSKEVLVRSFDIRFAQDGHDEINVAIAGLKDELAAEQPYVVEVKVI